MCNSILQLMRDVVSPQRPWSCQIFDSLGGNSLSNDSMTLTKGMSKECAQIMYF